MDRERLLQNPLPIDRVARRVTKKAKAEDVWMPQPKFCPDAVTSSEVLAVTTLPGSVPAHIRDLVGKRRGRMVIVGYSANQGSGCTAKWVVRCDCGNYGHRKRIVRWLGTMADDMCAECQRRGWLLRGGRHSTIEKAERETLRQVIV
jgi:hypothetical protein